MILTPPAYDVTARGDRDATLKYRKLSHDEVDDTLEFASELLESGFLPSPNNGRHAKTPNGSWQRPGYSYISVTRDRMDEWQIALKSGEIDDFVLFGNSQFTMSGAIAESAARIAREWAQHEMDAWKAQQGDDDFNLNFPNTSWRGKKVYVESYLALILRDATLRIGLFIASSHSNISEFLNVPEDTTNYILDLVESTDDKKRLHGALLASNHFFSSHYTDSLNECVEILEEAVSFDEATLVTPEPTPPPFVKRCTVTPASQSLLVEWRPYNNVHTYEVRWGQGPKTQRPNWPTFSIPVGITNYTIPNLPHSQQIKVQVRANSLTQNGRWSRVSKGIPLE